MAKTNYAVYQKAIRVYGKDEQLRMAQEECAELIQAVNKYHRAIKFGSEKEQLTALENIIEETADVEIMCEQIRIITGSSSSINAIKEEKTKRLEKRLGKKEKKNGSK